jgi:uncharacterized protein
MIDGADRDAVAVQLGRPPRASRSVAHRCSCGLPDVVETSPRLEDGTPFPTLFYLTCPRLASAIGRLESSGLMRTMTARLADDPDLAMRYRAAYDDYLSRRDAIEPLGTSVAAGGMPDRVKCLHVVVAHALAVGPGVNPFGDETLELLRQDGDWAAGDWGAAGRCVVVS